jgi:hypothetical protein
MKKYLSYLLVGLLTQLACIDSYAQTNDLNTIIGSYENYNSHHLPEKLYVHTDKSTYVNNEICWFKIYTLDGFFHQPLSLNKVAYIELLDEQNIAILQEKIGLNNASGNGSFQLPANIPTGKYTMVAYTNWMKNFDPQFFFSKPITIINTQNNASPTVNPSKKTESFQVNVYPESGQLLNGINNTVGFSVTNKWGKGMNAKGWIINNKQDTIIGLKTVAQGLGHFNFTPIDGESYKIVLETIYGVQDKDLPKANNNGYVLQINNTQLDEVKVTIHSATTTNTKSYLIVHSRGIIKKALQLALTNKAIEINIPTSFLGEGINCFTLFDADKNPVAERLSFNYPNFDQSKIQLESSSFKTRQKINVSISTPQIFDASVSVYKIDSLQSMDESTIQNYVLLSSDLIGKVEAPQSYFDLNNSQRVVAMDNLMLTQGWRRFTQENLVKNDTTVFSYLPEIGGSIITGKILNKGTTSPSKETAGYLSVPSKNTVFKSAISDKEGKIMFQFDEFMNEGQIIAQADSAKNTKNRIEIDNPFVGKKIAKANYDAIEIANLDKNSLTAAHRNTQVQNFYTPQFTTQFASSLQDTNAFYYTPDRTYYLDDYARFTTLEEVIREYVTPVTLVKEKGRYQFYVYDEAYKQFFEQSPLVLLDGVIIKDIDKFLEYDPLKIRKLEVVSRVYFSGNLAYNGIINFTTYTGKLEGFEIDPNAVVLDYKGLQAKRIFNAPVYENGDQQENRIPDFRQLLFWKPDLQIDRKQKLSFYSSDSKGNYIISVQGLSKDGKLLNQTAVFEVK